MGGLFKSKSKTTTTQQQQSNQTTTPTPMTAIEPLYGQIGELAGQIGRGTYQPFTGQRIADFGTDTQGAFQQTRDLVNDPSYYNTLSQLQQRLGGTINDRYAQAAGAFSPMTSSSIRNINAPQGIDIAGILSGIRAPGQVDAQSIANLIDPQNVSAQMIREGGFSPQKVSAQRVQNGTYIPQQVRTNYDISAALGALSPRNVGTNFNADSIAREQAPQQVNAAMFDRDALARYENPYQSDVIDAALNRADRQAGVSRAALSKSQAGKKAFGSRADLAQGTFEAENVANQRNLIADLKNQGFQQSIAQFNADAARRLAADQANQGAGLQAAQLSQAGRQADQAARLQAQEMGQRGELANQQVGLASGQSGLQATLDAMRMGQQGQVANQGAGITAEQLRQAAATSDQDAELRAGLANQGAGITAEQLRQAAAIANQNAGLQADFANQQASLTGQRAQADILSQLGVSNADRAMQGDMSRAQLAGQLQGQNIGFGLQGQQLGLTRDTAAADEAFRVGQANRTGALNLAQLGLSQDEQNRQGLRDTANFATAARQQQFGDIGRLMGIGQAQDTRSQMGLDAAYQEYLRGQQDPYQRLSALMSAAYGAPTGQTSSGTSSSTGTSTTSSGPGLVQGLIGSALMGLQGYQNMMGGGQGMGGMTANAGNSFSSMMQNTMPTMGQISLTPQTSGAFQYSGSPFGFANGGRIGAFDFSDDDEDETPTGAFAMPVATSQRQDDGFLSRLSGALEKSVDDPLFILGSSLLSSNGLGEGIANATQALSGRKARQAQAEAMRSKQGLDLALKLEELQMRRDEAEQRADDRRLDREQRAEAAKEAAELRREQVALSRENAEAMRGMQRESLDLRRDMMGNRPAQTIETAEGILERQPDGSWKRIADVKGPAGGKWEPVPDNPGLQRNTVTGEVKKATMTPEQEAELERQSSGKRINELLDVIEAPRGDAEKPTTLLDEATGSGIGAAYDWAAGLLGATPGGATEAQQLKAIAGQLIAAMPKMSGPQSDKDVQLYREMAGEIGDAAVPTERKKAAVRILRELNAKYAGGAQSVAAPKPSSGWGIEEVK